MSRQDELEFIEELEKGMQTALAGRESPAMEPALTAVREYANIPDNASIEEITQTENRVTQTFEAFLLELSNLETLGLNEFIHGLTAGPSRTPQEERQATHDRRKMLHAIIMQETQAEAMRRFNDALDNAREQIPKGMGDLPQRITKFRQTFEERLIEFQKQDIEDLSNVEQKLEAVEKRPTDLRIEAAEEAVDAALESSEQQKAECDKHMDHLKELKADARRRAEDVMPLLEELASALPPGEGRNLAQADLKSAHRWLNDDGQVTYNDQHIKKLRDYVENSPDLSDEQREMFQKYLEVHAQSAQSFMELHKNEELVREAMQAAEEKTRILENTKASLQKLKETPEAERLADFDSKEAEMMQKIEALTKDLEELRTVVQERQNKLQELEASHDQKLQAVIDDLNKKFQQEGSVSQSSQYVDKLSDAWESAKGMIWDDADLRYRYTDPQGQVHKVILAAESKLYYYLDENERRVLLPVQEQRRLRSLDKNDAHSRLTEKFNETLSDLKNGKVSEATATMGTGLANAASDAGKNILETADAVVDSIADTASSAWDYIENLNVFAPDPETTPPLGETFKESAQNPAAVPAPTQEKTLAPPGP